MVLATVLVTSPIFAVPGLINYQGKLTDSGGSALNGTFSMTFHLYGASSGGGSLWNETQSVQVTDGIYSVQLGAANPLDESYFSNDSIYLEVVVEGETLSPRQRLTSTAFAMKAALADSVLDGAVTTVMIADNAVDTQKVADSAITSGKVANNAITSDKIVDGAVTAADIFDGPDSGLDADRLDGQDASAFAGASHGHSFAGITGAATDAQIPNNITIDYAATAGSADYATTASDADTVDGQNANEFAASTHSHDHGSLSGLSDDDHTQYFNLSQNETVSGRPAFNGGTFGSSPFTVDSSYLVASLNADMVDGQHASAFASLSHSHDSIYYTESESDSRFVNTAGDTMSASSSGAVLTVANSGYGHAIYVSDAGQDGLYISGPAATGVYVSNAGWDGLIISNPSDDGVDVLNAGGDGVSVSDAGNNGVYVSSAGNNGVSVSSATWDGVYVWSAGEDGVDVASATYDGIHIDNAGDDGIQIVNAAWGLYAPGMTNYGVYVSGGSAGGYFEDTDSNYYAYIAYGSYGIYTNGDIYASGTKSFVQEHPTRSDQVIVYAALEGGEAGTYYRGTAQLTEGAATIELPEHFALITEEEGLTVQVTPRADCNGIYVADVSTTGVVVRELQGGTSNARFDFFVNGIRSGYADYEVINSKSQLGLDEMEEARQQKEQQEAKRQAERERERKTEQEKRQKEKQKREREREKRSREEKRAG
jgi:hypothetical protein